MYKLIKDFDGVMLVAEGTFIPNNPDLRLWVEYQAWLAEGNQPLPAE